ncbi:MAG: hypothetical protein RMI89_01180 [Gloeomargarita sp. SKYBB_i_bin120]|nr:hypothetical protein [Gloeomargarita sp. SKYB120]MDW8177134.1 hypothetical protein [Gloeomargarita sp. SKYBB_i_bin120]
MAKALVKFATMLVTVAIIPFTVTSTFAQSKVSCMVVTFSNATKNKNIGATVGQTVSSKLSASPSYKCKFDAGHSYDNLPAALEAAKNKGADILVTGVVTTSKAMGASAAITFDADVRFVSDGAIILDKTYSASDASVNKALNKAVSMLVKDMESTKGYILKVISK